MSITCYRCGKWTGAGCACSDGQTVILGDCREVLPQIDAGCVDLVLTDPPYSDTTHRNAKSNRGVGHGNKAIDFQAIDFQAIDFQAIENLMVECGRICSGWFVSSLDWRHIASLESNTPSPWEFMRFGVWMKTNPMPQISADRPAQGWEGIAYLRRGDLKPKWNGGGNHGNWYGPVVTSGAHPTVKPLGMVRTITGRFTSDDSTILDPFAGSFTTARAAKDLGRKSICIEISEKYCEIGARRLEQSVLPFEQIEQGGVVAEQRLLGGVAGDTDDDEV